MEIHDHEESSIGEDEFDSHDYKFSKRPAIHPPSRANEIYVTRKSSFHAQLQRAKTLLQIETASTSKGFNEVLIHGLGAAIPRAIKMATVLIAAAGGETVLGMWPTTSTVSLIDDFEPLTEEAEPKSQVRLNSAIHIRVYKLQPECESSQQEKRARMTDT